MHPTGSVASPLQTGNQPKVMALIKACSKLSNGTKSRCQGSLRELRLPLLILDDVAREAIEYHSLSLEVLSIEIMLNELDTATSNSSKRQTQVLGKLLRSCRQLRVFEFWDMCRIADVSCTMEDLMERPSKSQGGYNGLEQALKEDIGVWESPNLESLALKAGWYLEPRVSSGLLEEKERRYPVDEGDGESREWVMPTQGWDTHLQDGTDMLLDARWSGFHLFEEDTEGVEEEAAGDKLIGRFLQHIAPSKKLKKLQLSQLKFCRKIHRAA